MKARLTMKIIRATLETRKFYFEAYAQTKSHACAALVDGLLRHAAAYKLSEDWFSPDEIEYREFFTGHAYRDTETI
jgi:hypothetical protein